VSIWKAIWRIIRYRPGLYILTAINWGLIRLLPLLPGLITREILNLLAGEATPVIGFWGLIALLMGVAAGRIGLIFLGFVTWPRLYHLTVGMLQVNMLTQIFKRPGARALPGSPGEAISRFRGDVYHLADISSDWSFEVMGMSFSALVGLVILFSVNARLTLAVVVPLLIVIVVVTVVRRYLEKYREASRKAAGRVTAFIGDIFGGVQTIKVNDAERRVKARFDGINEARRKAALKDTLFSEVLHTIFHSTIEVSMGLILLLAAQVMTSGGFTVGDFALFVAYLEPVTLGITAFGNMIAMGRQTAVSLRRMVELLQEAAPETLVARTPVHLDGRFPEIPYTPPGSPTATPIQSAGSRGSICASTRAALPSSLGVWARARARCSRFCWGCCHATGARFAGTANWSTIRRPTLHRPAAPTRPRCPVSLATRCGITS